MMSIYNVSNFLDNDTDALKARFHFKNREYIAFNHRNDDYYNLLL